MNSILVKHFGPIVNDEALRIELRKVTFICGRQGAGKSTIAKLISEFTWLEKAITRGDFPVSELTGYDHFRKKYCAYHNIHNYFRKNSYIQFEGDKYRFEYKDGYLTVELHNGNDYQRPQVLYMPAERNFMTAIEDADKVKRLPQALSSIIDDYYRGLKNSKGKIALPMPGYEVQYDKLNHVTWLVGNSCKVKMLEAASGFQSVAPLSIVSNYLIGLITNPTESKKKSETSVEERERIQKTIQNLLKDDSLTEEVRHSLIMELNAGMRNQRFVNIVEEPEQNLFPSSQRYVLYELLSINNAIANNVLLITTHSPYITNYLTLAIKAGEMIEKLTPELKERMNDVIPLQSCVKADEVAVYELSEDGKIAKLPTYDGLPSDTNYLNTELQDTNVLFDELLDIEEEMI